MKLPNYNYENKFLKRGFKNIAGLDEAGRGSWAGPIVASAVITSNFKIKSPGFKIKDSKKLSPFQREKLFKIIKTKAVSWSIGIVNEKIIDKIGVGKANILVFKKAIQNLKIKPDIILLDGNLKIDKIKVPSYNIIKGDEKVFSCSCASIIAKVYRDHLMKGRLHKKYPCYGFNKHKGYGTKYHLKMIKKYGICPSHRKSFNPIKNYVNSSFKNSWRK